MIKKRGLSHIEVVLAFILFIVFVSLGIFLFQPFTNTQDASSSLTYVSNRIITNLSTDLLTYSVKINTNQPVIGISIPDAPADMNVVAFNYSGDYLNAKREGNVVYVDITNQKFIFIRYGYDLPASSFNGNGPTDESNYKIGSLIKQEVISENSALALNKSYYENYEDVKKYLKISSNIDYGFDIIFQNGDKIAVEKNVPSGLQVYSNVDSMEVVRTDGTTTFANIIIKTW